MKPRIHKQDSLTIVYDADCMQQPGSEMFDPDYWAGRGLLRGEARGRGSAWFIETDCGSAVLRRYLRGGWAARFSRDRYLYTGETRTRPLAEFELLQTLAQTGLPVPMPLAAMCNRQGLFYTGSLLTRRLQNTTTLADRLAANAEDPELFGRVGACIAQFHRQGVIHADLNARNILVRDNGEIYLIDFDRGHIRLGDRTSFEGNLSRLRRSLLKLWPRSAPNRLDEAWQALEEGYRQG